MKISIKIIIVCLLAASCGAGTLGGFPEITFDKPMDTVLTRINKLKYQDTTYNLPVKWEKYDDWSERGYDFLKGHIFYFKAKPEEMYYVSFIGDSGELATSAKCRMSVRSVFQEKTNWLLYEHITAAEKRRIQTRFKNEIIEKLK